MNYALLFGLTAMVAAGSAWGMLQLGQGWAVAPGLWGAVAFGIAALAYAGAGPGVFGKRPDGSVPLWSYLVLGPFLVVGRAGLRAFNATGVETAWSRVGEGVWLGRRPHGPDEAPFHALQPTAVLDLTAEVARSRNLTGREAYLTLPVLDNAAPRPEQLDAGIAFIEAHRPNGPVYVHCALGNGRAATMTAAWLLATGQAGGVAQAEANLKALRPSVGLSRAQRSGLEAWWTARD